MMGRGCVRGRAKGVVRGTPTLARPKKGVGEGGRAKEVGGNDGWDVQGRAEKQGPEARGECLLSHGLRTSNSHPGPVDQDPVLPPR